MPEAADGLIGAFKARNGEERSSTGGVAGAVATGPVVGVVVAVGVGRVGSGADATGAATVIVADGTGTVVGTGMATGLMLEPLSMASC